MTIKIIYIIRKIMEQPLNKNHRFRAILRFLSWQIGIRILKKPVVVDYVNGSRLIVNKSMRAATGNIYYGLLEFICMSFVLHLLRKEDLMIDIGANVGTYTILASKAVGSRCLAFEPIPSTFKHLTDNININQAQDKVVSYNIGIGDINGKLFFTANLDTTNHVIECPNNSSETIEVETRKLDDVVKDLEPTLIKIDVEGFEENVLKGASTTLRKDSLLAVIIETFGESSLDGIMESYGFKAFTYLPYKRTMKPLSETKNAITNTIYIKNVNEVNNRLRSAMPFKVLGQEI